jgi:hypothetical protein
MGSFLHQYFWSKQDEEAKVIVVVKHLKESQLQKGVRRRQGKQGEKGKVIVIVKHLKRAGFRGGSAARKTRRISQGNRRWYTFEGSQLQKGVRRQGKQ